MPLKPLTLCRCALEIPDARKLIARQVFLCWPLCFTPFYELVDDSVPAKSSNSLLIDQKMAQPKYNNARLVPFILMSIVTLIFLFWAMRQCSPNDHEFAMQAEEETRRSYLDTLRERDHQQILQRKLDSIEQAAKAAALLRSMTTPLPGDSLVRGLEPRTVVKKVTPLYSTIEGLNVRTGPSLKYKVVARLPLYGEVNFLGKVTDSLYQIDLGDITPSAPWVKVELPDGKQGWVYGALVSYYKYKQTGVKTD